MDMVSYKSFENKNNKPRWYYIIITRYGACKVNPNTYNSKRALTISSALDKTAYFINQCNERHSNKYDYALTLYKSSKKKVIITCPMHGNFNQLPTSHKKGAGCPSCASLVSREQNIIVHTDILVNLYIIKCYDDNELFYKIGITAKNVELRFKYKNQLPYEYEVIKSYNDDIGIIHKLEQHLHSSFANVNYKPQKKFAGHTECFTCIDNCETIIDKFINC